MSRNRAARSAAPLWLAAFLGFFLLQAGWTMAAPYDGPPDEIAHTLRSYGVYHGPLLPADPVMRNAPGSLVRYGCFIMKADVSADCQADPGGNTSPRPYKVTATYYNPAYYLVAGWPVALWPEWPGIIGARLITGAIIAALLASSVVAACRWASNRGVLAGIVVAATPMLAHLGGSINPSGVEIAAGIALFSALIPVLLQPWEHLNRAAVALAGVSASALVMLRSLGPLWLTVIVGVMLIPASRVRLRTLAHDRWVRWWGSFVLLSTAVAVAWDLMARPNRVPSHHLGLGLKEIIKGAVLGMWPNLANQMVGVMGYADTLQPGLVYLAWFLATGLLVLGGFVMGSRTERWRLIALAAATFIPLISAELLLVNQLGFFNQGRYFLPGAVGLPILGGFIMGRRGLAAHHLRVTVRLFAVVLVPVHLVCLAYTMNRWQSGMRILNPFKGSWLPPLGPELPLALTAVGVVILIVLYWRIAPTPEATPSIEQSPTAATDGTQLATGALSG